MLKKILLIMITCLLFVSCAELKNAQKEYDNGNYVESVSIATKYLDKKKNLKNGKEKDQIMGLFNNIIVYYENEISKAVPEEYDKKAKALSDLLKIRKLTDNKYYDSDISFFTSKYTIDGLREKTAIEYYNKGNSIGYTTETELKRKYEAYQTGLSYYPYKDIAVLYEISKKSYHELRAEKFYLNGLTYEKQNNYAKAEEEFQKVVNEVKNYKDAESRRQSNRMKRITQTADNYYESGKAAVAKKAYCDATLSFSNAHTSYAEIGKYKDASELSNKYNEDCKKEKSTSYYNEALTKLKTARTRKDYRDIASIFNSSYNEYSYSGFNNAKAMKEKYESMGTIKIYIRDSEYSSLMKRIMRDNYIKFVSYQGDADVIIKVDENPRFFSEGEREVSRKEHRITQQIDTLKAVDAMGNVISTPVNKEYIFTEIVLETRNVYEIRGTVSSTGDVRFNDRINVERSYTTRKIVYRGDIPPGYHNQNVTSHENEYSLKNEVKRDFERKLEDVLEDLYDDILYL